MIKSSINLPEQFKNFKSYSRYRGYPCEYSLSDRYISRIVDGNLICTDTECDIDFDGNIVLVRPDGFVVHIGKVPEVEGKVTFSWNSDENLVMKYKDNYRGVQQEVINTHLTEELYLYGLALKLAYSLKKRVRVKNGGTERGKLDTCAFVQKQAKTIGVHLYGTLTKIGYGRHRSDFNYSQDIVYVPGQGFLLCSINGEDVIGSVFGDNHRLNGLIDEFNEENNLCKRSSYRVMRVNEFSCTILDKSDDVKETVTKEDCIKLVERGVRIWGISKQLDNSIMFRESYLSV